jgi:hypothetical protein
VQLVFNLTAEELNITSKLYDWGLINAMYGDTIPLIKSVNIDKLEFYNLCWKIIYVS